MKKLDRDITTTSSVTASTSAPSRHLSSSQPFNTGSGKEILTQVVYAIDYLKSKDKPVSFDDIWSYLCIAASQQHYAVLRRALIEHPRVDYDPQGLDGHSSFRFRPVYNIRTADDLMNYLKRQTSAQYVSVEELKEGWPTAVAEVEALESKGQALVRRVVRNKRKDMLVWLNDPSLTLHIDQDFQDYWHSIKLPSDPRDLRSELEEAGFTLTSQVKEMVTFNNAKGKKRKISRKIVRTTNVHMDDILNDYSQVQKQVSGNLVRKQ